MISVNVSFIGKNIKKFIVSGHAEYDEAGKDLVCAGVSAIVIGGINALENEIANLSIINKKNELGVEVINDNDKIQIILNTIYIQLKTIEESYSKYIKINRN